MPVRRSELGAKRLQIVFIDIVGYSRRSTARQRSLIERFQQDVLDCLIHVGDENLPYFASQGIAWPDDLVKIPTGDGIALSMGYEALPRLALDFAALFLSRIHLARSAEPCLKFHAAGWCDCHDYYGVRLGIADGGGFVYRDLNGNRNVAGKSINTASRIMSIGAAGHLLLTESFCANMLDMTGDHDLSDRLRPLGTIAVKHGEQVRVVQYIGAPGDAFINRSPATTLCDSVREYWPESDGRDAARTPTLAAVS
jgi:hypothetical protein